MLSFSFIMGFIIWGDSANWVGDLDSDDDDAAAVRGWGDAVEQREI